MVRPKSALERTRRVETGGRGFKKGGRGGEPPAEVTGAERDQPPRKDSGSVPLSSRETELVPFAERVNANFRVRPAEQEQAGQQFTDEQHRWLEMIRDHIAANLGIETDDFEYAPFSQEGGLGKVYQLFGEELGATLDDLSRSVVA